MDSPTIPIDPHGDVTLVVGANDEVKSFLVSSKILSVASPVWRAMLSTRNGFIEAGSEEIIFPDDNPEALFIIFLACHMRFQEVPAEVKFQNLMNLCTVCDKYDCISLLQPWLSAWTTPWLEHVGDHGFEGWAFIAWVIGDVDVFENATDELVLTCTTNESGQCLTEDGTEVLDHQLTHGLAEAILEARTEAIRRLIEACHEMIHRYVSQERPFCKTNVRQIECDTLVFGPTLEENNSLLNIRLRLKWGTDMQLVNRSLVKPLQTMHLWPGNPGKIPSSMPNASVGNILSKIREIKCYAYQEANRHPSPHGRCGFTTELQGITGRIVMRKAEHVLEVNRKHLELQQGRLRPLMAPLSLE